MFRYILFYNGNKYVGLTICNKATIRLDMSLI